MAPSGRFRPTADELRTQAHDLKRDVLAGDVEALKRVPRLHPKADKIDLAAFTLRDAQVVLAREAGFRSWKAMIDGIAPPPEPDRRRWQRQGRAFARIAEQAKAEGFATMHGRHLVRAILATDPPSIAARALRAAGLDAALLDHEAERVNQDFPQEPTTMGGTRSTQAQQMLLARAEGLALAEGTDVTDEHLLLALLFDGDGRQLAGYGVRLDDAYQFLIDHGVCVPKLLPPPQPKLRDMSQMIYVRQSAVGPFHQILMRFHAVTDRHFGLSPSTARPGWRTYVADISIDLASIARGTLSDDDWELIAAEVGAELERNARWSAAGHLPKTSTPHSSPLRPR